MANATVIKLTNNAGTTLLPLSDSAYIQHKQDNWITSAHDIISYTYGLAHHDHNDIQTISYSNGNGITLSGQTGKVDIKGSEYIQITGATDTLTISTNARPGTVTGVTITQGDGITVSNSGIAISTSGTRTISHASVGALSKTYTSPEGKYFNELQFDKFGHLRTYSTANLPTFTDTNTTVITNGTTDVTANHINSEKITLTGGTNKFTVKQGSSQFDVAITPSITNNVTGSGLTADTIILGNGNSSIKTSSKTITPTAPTSGSGDTAVPTSKAVYTAYTAGDIATLNSAKEYADGLVTSAIKFVNTVTEIPTAAAHGEAYLIGNVTSLSVNGTVLEPGDMIIAYNGSNETGGLQWATSNTNWTVSSNDTTLTIGNSSLQTIATVGGKAIKAKVGAITNNVTGSGTSGKLTKWNGTNTITDGPSIQTATWTSSSTNIPDCNAVGAYIAGKNYITSYLSFVTIQATGDSSSYTAVTASENTAKAIADANNDTLQIGGGNYWIDVNVTDSSNTDKVLIGHALSSQAAITTASLKKIKTDAAGHITGIGDPSTGSPSTTVGMKYVPYKTDAADFDSTWLSTIGTAGTATNLLSTVTGTFVTAS